MFVKNKIKLLQTKKKSFAGRCKYGNISILSKGKITRYKYVYTDINRTWNIQLFAIIGLLSLKFKKISLIKYACGSISYSSFAHGNEVGQTLFSSQLPAKYLPKMFPGNIMLLKYLKSNSIIFNISNILNKTIFAKANGVYAQILEHAYDFNLTKILLPSGSSKLFNADSFVTLGRNSEILTSRIVFGKSSRMRFKGLKSRVRGVAKNPVDHPHGGRTKTNQPERSPWGWIAKRNK